MKIFVLCNSDLLALPAVNHLYDNGKLIGVGFPQKNKGVLYPGLTKIGIAQEDCVALARDSWDSVLAKIIEKKDVNTIWVLTFPWRVPNELLDKAPLGFINFHFGILPQYKGIDPVFWQFKNREKLGGITVHQMNSNIDEGPVLLQEEMQIVPGENYGFHCQKLGQFITSILDKVGEMQNNVNIQHLDLSNDNEVFDKKPSESDLSIDWQNQTADEIEALVNATNPKYGGARTTIGDMEMRILEVTPADLENPVESLPGQIIHADAVYGLIVTCKDQRYLRITLVGMAEGYLSGVKLFGLGITAGYQFV